MKLLATSTLKLATCGQVPTARRIVVTRTVWKAPGLRCTTKGITNEIGGSLEEEAFLAALDSGSAQMLGLVLPAFRRAKTWEESVRAAYEAMFSFGIEEPEYTQLGAVEMYTVGRRALQTRDTVMEGLEALLAPGFELAPTVPPIYAELIGGAIYALIHDQVKETARKACRNWRRWPPT